MVFYFSKRFDATQVGGVVVSVTCDRCGCEYFYELTRTAEGTGTAPYGLGAAAAARTAQENAESAMLQRLTTEADLVPCPQCHWINEELVLGYRQGQYRGFRLAAIVIGAVGTVGSLVGAWFISIGPPG